MHFTEHSLLITAAVLAFFAFGMAMYTANKRKGK